MNSRKDINPLDVPVPLFKLNDILTMRSIDGALDRCIFNQNYRKLCGMGSVKSVTPCPESPQAQNPKPPTPNPNRK